MFDFFGFGMVVVLIVPPGHGGSVAFYMPVRPHIFHFKLILFRSGKVCANGIKCLYEPNISYLCNFVKVRKKGGVVPP